MKTREKKVVVVLARPGAKRGRVLARFHQVRSAELFISKRALLDPEGVNRGDYTIDAPEPRAPKPPKIDRAFVIAVEFHKREIARHRDALRDLINDAESIADTCDDAIEGLNTAIDTLSQYL